jgi:transcription elongation regulator 1
VQDAKFNACGQILTNQIAPTGHVYYFNASTNESTYTRPLPSFANLPRPAPAATKKKKEKPLTKTPIPGTEWIRVRTTENNIFYSHKPTKKSLWTVPDEIAEAVRALELDEEAEESRKAEEARKTEEEAEVERVKREAQEASNKRKAGEKPVEGVKSKKARVEEVKDEDEGGDDDESEEEEWQRDAAAQLAAEAEEAEKKRKEEEELAKAEEQRQKDEMEAKAKQLNLPDRVDLSLDEAKALFKVCACIRLRSTAMLTDIL